VRVLPVRTAFSLLMNGSRCLCRIISARRSFLRRLFKRNENHGLLDHISPTLHNLKLNLGSPNIPMTATKASTFSLSRIRLLLLATKHSVSDPDDFQTGHLNSQNQHLNKSFASF